MEIQWDEPPDVRRQSSLDRIFTDDLLEGLRGNPGRWARIAENVSNATPVYWRKKFPELEFRAAPNEESTSKRRRYIVWVRYPES